MFSVAKELGAQAMLKREALPFLVSFVIAESLYKFGSFTFECLAFLGTWLVLSYLQSLAMKWGDSPEPPARHR